MSTQEPSPRCRYLNAPQVDHVVVIKDGTVWEQGTYAQLMDRPDGEMRRLMDECVAGFVHRCLVGQHRLTFWNFAEMINSATTRVFDPLFWFPTLCFTMPLCRP
jgi:hypothetical protein